MQRENHITVLHDGDCAQGFNHLITCVNGVGVEGVFWAARVY